MKTGMLEDIARNIVGTMGTHKATVQRFVGLIGEGFFSTIGTVKHQDSYGTYYTLGIRGEDTGVSYPEGVLDEEISNEFSYDRLLGELTEDEIVDLLDELQRGFPKSDRLRWRERSYVELDDE